MNDLKPCPFFGGEAILVELEYSKSAFIRCKNHCCEQELVHKTKEEALEAWNRRAEAVHGRWEDGICTMCGYPIPTDSKCDFIDEDDCLFCYHCGAKMKGENEDG